MDPHSDKTALIDDMAEAMEGRFYGKYRGVVTSNEDATGRGRLKVKAPAVMGDEAVWALPCVPYAGENAGSFMIPEPDTLVWIEFEAGDPSYPIWTGCLWPDKHAPKNNQKKDAAPPVKVIRSKEGLMVSLDDSGQVIDVSDEDGSNVLTIEVTKGRITLKGANKAVVEAPQIELVENATHPVVFGDELTSYLQQLVQIYQSHTHPGVSSGPGSTGPPVPPMQPPTPTLISKKVKSG